jgi:hypothetical protein
VAVDNALWNQRLQTTCPVRFFLPLSPGKDEDDVGHLRDLPACWKMPVIERSVDKDNSTP